MLWTQNVYLISRCFLKTETRRVFDQKHVCRTSTDPLWGSMTHFAEEQTRRLVWRRLWTTEHTPWKPLIFKQLPLYFSLYCRFLSIHNWASCLHSRFLHTWWSHVSLAKDKRLPVWRGSSQRFGCRLQRPLAPNTSNRDLWCCLY